MKVAIVNTRGRVKWFRTLSAIKESGFNITEIISWPRRKALVDLNKYADRHSIKVRVFETRWDTLGRDAPGHRDDKIIAYCDAVIAIWDHKSPDIREFLAKSFVAGLPTHIYLI